MRKAFNGIIYSFPVQLFALHLKRNHFLILTWIFLISISAGLTGTRYGISLLFLDPEYLGKVNFSSFCILGASMGAFLMVWNVTSYILNAHNFSFLATLNRPFGVYCLNNIILPIIFFSLYIFEIIAFQSNDGLLTLGHIAVSLGGFFTGMFSIMMIAMIYFFRTNKDIFQIIGIIKKKNDNIKHLNPQEPTHEEIVLKNKIKVEYYLNNNIRWKHARSADHYPESIIRSVYKQHHVNALFIEISSIFLIVLFGLLMDYPVFRIPAGSSIVLLVAIMTILIGAFSYWMGAWKLFFLFFLIFMVNAMMQSNLLTYQNKVYGLNYDSTSVYSLERLNLLSDSASTTTDINTTLSMLENWKKKFPANGRKPKMVVINCSGGGLRAMAFAMQVFQNADSITDHNMMKQCALITGASGGMIAAAYYRELYLRFLNGENINLSDDQYAANMSEDLLNAVCFTIIVNDLFYPWQKYAYNNETYRKDRGYMFEKILNENTDSVLIHPLSAYKEAEYNMQIPLMIFTPTIINDERKLYISTHPVSYLAKPLNRINHFSKPEIDGVDIHRLLSNNKTDSISFTSVLRMNCTFPYILPNVHLPSTPQIEIMDAGIRDNYGVQTSTQFIEVFKDWILKNTSGVIVVNIRAIEQEMAIKMDLSKGVMGKFVSPVENLYSNWVEIQDYQNDQLLNYLDEILDGKLEVITFEYQASENNKRASLSFHLTAKEKRDIQNSVTNVYNNEAYRKLTEVLGSGF